MASALFFALLCLGCWRSFVTANDPCIPEVRGEPFVQYVKNKNCEVDEKLLKMFNLVSFNDSVVNKPSANFMCTGFIDALNQAGDSTLENLCVLGLLGDIRDTDFCSDDKIMRVLEEVVDSAVFDKISKTVSNFTRHHCNMICSSSNELCWAFGITAKLVLKQSVMSTTTPTTATEPTTAPTTEATTTTVSLPDLFTTKPQPPDDHADDDDVDTTGELTDDNKNDTSKFFQEGTSDVQTPPVASSHEDVDATAGIDASDEPEIPISPNTDDGQDVQNNVTINDNDSDSTENPTAASPTDDNATTIIANTTVMAEPTTDNTTTTAATNASDSPSAQNVTTLEGYISEEGPPGSDTIPVDVDDYYTEDTDQTGQTSQEDQSNHDNSDHSSIMDHVIDVVDDDDDDGYSYWHFAAILLFILFLGVAGYLASHNRKKIRESVSTYMSKRKRKREYKPVNTMEAGLS